MNAVPAIVRDANGHALLVLKEGRTKLHAIALHTPPVRIVKLERRVQRELVDLSYKGKPYPLKRAVRLFRTAGRTFGITGSAREALEALRVRA